MSDMRIVRLCLNVMFVLVCLNLVAHSQVRNAAGGSVPVVGDGDNYPVRHYPDYNIYCDPMQWMPGSDYCGCPIGMCLAPVPVYADPTPPMCEVKAYWRLLTGVGIFTNYYHTFLVALEPTQWTWVSDAGPVPNAYGIPYLDAWSTRGFTGHLTPDNPGAAWNWWSTTLSEDNCPAAVSIRYYVRAWPQDTMVYHAYTGPNSNSFTHQAAIHAGLNPTTPTVSTPGW